MKDQRAWQLEQGRELSALKEKIDHCEDDVGLLQQGQTDQEMFNWAILERMREMEMKIDGQVLNVITTYPLG